MRTGTSSAPLDVRVLPAGRRPEAAAVWRRLEDAVQDPGLMCSWVWTGTWLDHFGDLVPHRFVIAERDGVPVGAALLTEGVGRRRGPFSVRTVHVGTAGEPRGESVYVEYNRLLVSAADRGDFARGLLRTVHRLPRWEELQLDGFAEDDAAALLHAEPRLRAVRRPCPTMDLAAIRAGGGDVLGALRSSVRWRVRRSLRAIGPLETEWAEDAGTAIDIFEELVGLHQARWTAAGLPGAFASARVLGFHRALIPELSRRGQVLLFRGRAAGGTVGCLYAHLERGRVLQYQSGFARSEDNRVKPGLTMHVRCMQACLDRGLGEYDLLAEGVRYKRELTNAERHVVWADVHRRRPRPMLIHGVRRVRALRVRREEPGVAAAEPAGGS